MCPSPSRWITRLGTPYLRTRALSPSKASSLPQHHGPDGPAARAALRGAGAAPAAHMCAELADGPASQQLALALAEIDVAEISA